MSKRPAEPVERYSKKSKAEPASSSTHPSGVAPLGNLYFATDPTNSRDAGLGLLGFFQDDILLYLLGLLWFFKLIFSPIQGGFRFWARDTVIGQQSLLFILWNRCVVARSIFMWISRRLPIWVHLENNLFKKEDQQIIFEIWPTPSSRYNNHKLYSLEPGFYSDVIYNAWYCAQINPYRWAKLNNIQRRENLSVEEFKAKYEKPGVPVIISDIVPSYVIHLPFQALTLVDGQPSRNGIKNI